MVISDEKIEQLLTIITESMKSMQAVQTENNKLHSDLLKLMSNNLRCKILAEPADPMQPIMMTLIVMRIKNGQTSQNQ